MSALDPVAVGKRLYRQVRDDDVGGLAAELAYHLLLALFPFFVFLAALGGLIGSIAEVANPTDALIDKMSANLPPETAGLLVDELRAVVETRRPGLLSLGAAAALWAATRGMNSLMKAMNRAYDVPESRRFLRRNLVALGLTLMFSLLMLAAFTLLVVGEFLAHEAATLLGLPPFVVDATRWCLSVAMIGLMTSTLYWAAPNIDLEFKWVSPGSVFFTLAWIAGTTLFALYVRSFGTYGATYGALGGMVVLLIWFYLTGFALVLGAELNAAIDQWTDPARLEQRRWEKKAEAAKRGEGGRARGQPPDSSHDQAA